MDLDVLKLYSFKFDIMRAFAPAVTFQPFPLSHRDVFQ